MTFRNGVKAIPAIFDTATTFKHEMSFEDFIHEIKNITYIGLNITRHRNKGIYKRVTDVIQLCQTYVINLFFEKQFISLSEQTKYST